MFRLFLKWTALACCLLESVLLCGQHQEIGERPNLWKGKHIETSDTTSILSAFKSGQVSGHFRSFWMNTVNKGSLKDFYALALGGGLRYESASFHGFQFAVSGFYIFDIFSSDFTFPDSATGALSRYELGLFDLTNPENHHDLDRLEELYLRYNFGKTSIKIGKQLVNTPFLNLQDGRMRPTGVNGLWVHSDFLNSWVLEGGIIYRISPRSTVRWYSIGESFGLYPVGVDFTGQPSGYAGNILSRALITGGLEGYLFKNVQFKLWNIWVHNVFNTSMMELHHEKAIEHNFALYSGVQTIHQRALKDGGNPDPLKAYIGAGTHCTTLGLRLGSKFKEYDFSLNYNQIFGPGRYLQPREWGREPFFTFMPRERNEGMAFARSFVLKADRKWQDYGWILGLAAGKVFLPDVMDFANNKYGLPSYYQFNMDVRYFFKGFLEGMDMQFLFVSKWRATQSDLMPKHLINKVDMWMINWIFNYHF